MIVIILFEFAKYPLIGLLKSLFSCGQFQKYLLQVRYDFQMDQPVGGGHSIFFLWVWMAQVFKSKVRSTEQVFFLKTRVLGQFFAKLHVFEALSLPNSEK